MSKHKKPIARLLAACILVAATVTLFAETNAGPGGTTNKTAMAKSGATNATATNAAMNTAAMTAMPAKPEPVAEQSFIRHYFEMGGICMYPLLLLSIVGFGIVLERYWYYWRHKMEITALANQVAMKIHEEGVAPAIHVCEHGDTTGARILTEGLRLHEAGIDRIEKGIATRGGIEIDNLERGLSILAAVANLAPLLGFLGTVTGMIASFKSIAGAETVSAQLVSNGIFEALITTAVGLMIAIPAFAFHNIFVHKIDKFATEVESAASTVVNTIILRDKQRKNEVA